MKGTPYLLHGDATAIDLLAIMAHPDDAELLCGGTLLRAADQGRSTGVLDLTRGELGSYGSPEDRLREARDAARILGLAVRANLGLVDGEITNDTASRAALASRIRELEPRIVITHGLEGRHPDHAATAALVRNACFIAGLRNATVDGVPHRPLKVLHACAYNERADRLSFVVDITEQMDRKLDAIFAYESQFRGRTAAGEIQAGGDRSLREQILALDAACGARIRTRFGEPFWTPETLRVDDVTTLQVSTY